MTCVVPPTAAESMDEAGTKLRASEIIVSLEADQMASRFEILKVARDNGDLVAFMDFDRTITKCYVDRASNKRGLSCHGVLESCNVLSEEFTSRCSAISQKYYPMEIDETISIEDKIPLMEEWYQSAHNLLLEEGLTEEKVSAAAKEAHSLGRILLREGVTELIDAFQNASPPVPLIIMSAGLGNMVAEVLKLALPFELKPSTAIVSNMLHFDEEGNHIGFSEPLMHMFNKSTVAVTGDNKALIEGKGHCLIFGDSEGDLTMADGGDYTEKLSVGFLNDNIENRMPQFAGPYDIVVTHDGPVPDVVISMLTSPSVLTRL